MRILVAIFAVLVVAGSADLALQTTPSALAEGAHGPTGAPPVDATTPEEKMRRRFPQPVQVGRLIGARVLDEGDVTIGRVREVARKTDGKLLLIVDYGGWFGWGARTVAIPVETVALIGQNVAALDISPDEISKLPTWSSAEGQPIGPEEIIKLAISRR